MEYIEANTRLGVLVLTYKYLFLSEPGLYHHYCTLHVFALKVDNVITTLILVYMGSP